MAAGAVLAIRMYREGIQNNYYFRNSRKPFTIGIAGDSGAGKDVFGSLSDLFGFLCCKIFVWLPSLG